MPIDRQVAAPLAQQNPSTLVNRYPLQPQAALLLSGLLVSVAAQTAADSPSRAADRGDAEEQNPQQQPADTVPIAADTIDNAVAAVLPQVVVSASRIEQDPKRLGVSFSVIEGETIDREQQVDLRRVLQDAPSVFISEIGARGSATSISIRGNRHQDTLLRVDGAKVSGGIIEGFSPYLAYAGTYNIERIEVIPGAQSVIYGSDGGTVSIFTRRGSGDPKFRVIGEAGSFESIRGGLEGDGSLGKLDYSFHEAYDYSDNDRDHNSVKIASYSLRLDHVTTNDLELGLAVRGHFGDYSEPGSTEPTGNSSDIGDVLGSNHRQPGRGGNLRG